MKRPSVIEIAMFCGVMFCLIAFFLSGGGDFTGISEQIAVIQSEEVADTQVAANPSNSQTSASASSARDNTKQALAETGKTYLKFKLIQRVFNTLDF